MKEKVAANKNEDLAEFYKDYFRMAHAKVGFKQKQWKCAAATFTVIQALGTNKFEPNFLWKVGAGKLNAKEAVDFANAMGSAARWAEKVSNGK